MTDSTMKDIAQTIRAVDDIKYFKEILYTRAVEAGYNEDKYKDIENIVKIFELQTVSIDKCLERQNILPGSDLYNAIYNLLNNQYFNNPEFDTVFTNDFTYGEEKCKNMPIIYAPNKPIIGNTMKSCFENCVFLSKVNEDLLNFYFTNDSLANVFKWTFKNCVNLSGTIEIYHNKLFWYQETFMNCKKLKEIRIHTTEPDTYINQRQACICPNSSVEKITFPISRDRLGWQDVPLNNSFVTEAYYEGPDETIVDAIGQGSTEGYFSNYIDFDTIERLISKLKYYTPNTNIDTLPDSNGHIYGNRFSVYPVLITNLAAKHGNTETYIKEYIRDMFKVQGWRFFIGTTLVE